jgi:hypothetical protein
MSKKDGLDAFLRSKASTEPEIDWEARKDRWISEIMKLYDQIKEWLAPLEKDEVVRYSTLTMTLQEDPIGSYQVDVLMLLVGKQRVEFRPKGTLIVGANGRVDIQGPRAMRTIVLQDGRWLIVERSPRVKTRPFDKDSLETVLKEVMA